MSKLNFKFEFSRTFVILAILLQFKFKSIHINFFNLKIEQVIIEGIGLEKFKF